MVCAVCSGELGSRWRGSHASERLCPACRLDPANIDWHEGESQIDGGADLDLAYTSYAGKPSPLRIGDTKIRQVTKLEAEILDLKIHGVRLRVRRIDRWGRSRGTYERRIDPSDRMTAKRAGCSRSNVYRVRSGLYA